MGAALPVELAASQTQSSAAAAATSGANKQANVGMSENASQNVGMSASSAAPVDSSGERSLVPSGGTGTGGTDAVDPINVDGDSNGKEDKQHASKRAKKSTSDVWQYFTKYWVTAKVNRKEEQQLWAKCNFKGCVNKTSKHRAEGGFGTTSFWTHLANYHSIKKVQLQLTTKTDDSTGVAVVQPYKYDQEASVRKFYQAMIVHEYPFNMVEHEYFQEWVKSLRPHYPSESAFSAGGRVVDPYRSSLDPEMVQALVCTKDCIVGANKKGSKNISSLPSDLEVLEAIKNSLQFQDEFSQMDEDFMFQDEDDMPEVHI